MTCKCESQFLDLMAEGVIAQEKKIAKLERELAEIRQAHWDGRALAGFDNDGDPTPEAVVSDFADMMRNDWKIQKEDYDELVEDYDELLEDRDKLLKEIRQMRADLSPEIWDGRF